MKSNTRKLLARAAALALISGAAAFAAPAASVAQPAPLNNQHFDYFITGLPGAPTSAGYVGAPFLTDANAAQVSAYLAGASIRAVKVDQPISNATAALIFNNPNYNVSYVLGDLEGNNAANLAGTLVKQVRYANGVSGAASMSAAAFVGNFGFSNLNNDSTQPKSYQSLSGTHSFSGFSRQAYNSTGLNMQNVELYPGSPSFRSTAAGNSSAPNLRSSLFVLPIQRLNNAVKSAPKGDITIPWATNFNNWNNSALSNASHPSNTQGYQYFFPNPTGDQMLSRQDFAAMIAHYRLQGAASFSLLNSGNTAITDAQMREDAHAGWLGGDSSINLILNSFDHETLQTGQVSGGLDGISKIALAVPADHGSKSFVTKTFDTENVGVVMSGAYSLSVGKLDILISNLDDESHTVEVPAHIGGYALEMKDFTIGAGTHQLVEFSLNGSGKHKGWANAVQHVPFTAIANSRNGFGIPEPGTLSLLVAGAVVGLNARRKPVAKKA